MKRWTLGLAGIAIAAVGAWQGDDLAAAIADLDERVTAIEERLESRPIGTAGADGPLRFEGDAGDTVSEPFSLGEGTVVFSFVVDVDATTIINLLSAPGAGETSFNVIVIASESERGTNAVPIFDAGEYILEVQADGPWSVVVEQ